MMNSLKNRIEKLEKVVRGIVGEEIVTFSTRTEEEFEKKKEEYLKTNPPPEIFVRIVKFGPPPTGMEKDLVTGLDKE